MAGKKRLTAEALVVRRERVLGLRCQGVPYRAIATRMGISPATARRDTLKALENLAEQEYGHTTTLRMQQIARLELLLRNLSPDLARERRVRDAKGEFVVKGLAATGEPVYQMEPVPAKERLPVIDRVLKIFDQTNRLLGLEAPQRLEADITVPDVPVSRFVLVRAGGVEVDVDPADISEDALGGRP